MLFSEALATIQPLNEGWSAEVSEDWSQGRAAYGGLAAALGNEAMRRLVPRERALRGLEIAFVGPLIPGKVRMQAEVLRIGKAITIASARLYSGAEVATTLTGIYGASRGVAMNVAAAAPSSTVAADSIAGDDKPPGGRFPAFLQHFDVKFAEGGRPFSRIPMPRSKVYIRHRDSAPLTESHVVALIDCIPPPLLQMMSDFVPASSLTWTLEFLRHDYDFSPDAWWRIDTEVKAAGNGYSQESSVVLDPNGVPMAFSRQLVAVFG
jgi:acyl-CoA thioesterase